VEKRSLGTTGLNVSVLGFGCGVVGGLMVRGTPADQERAVARAVELGVNYFDTAVMYGNGESEKNLGRVLAALRPDVVVATKAFPGPAERGKIGQSIVRSAETSLQRLRRERVDIFQLHTPVTPGGDDDTLAVATVVEEVIPAFEALRDQGKIRFFGFSGTGAPAALPALIDTGSFALAQVIYNAINASAGGPTFGALGTDFGNVLAHLQRARMGAVGIRVLAAGALSGVTEPHPLAPPSVPPMGSGADYRADVERARLLMPLVREGHVGSLVEAALRFAISHPAISTALVGFSDLVQIEYAAAAVEQGPLPPPALERIAALLPR